MKNTSKSNFARKNICKYLAFKNSSSLAKAIWQLQMAGYSKVKINFYWDCDAWNEVDFLWPKLLNYQLMFFKSNFISWMSKFLTGSFHYWISPFEPYPKCFGNPIIGLPKHWLGLQKFWTLNYCLNGLKSLRKSHLHNHRPTFSQKSMRHTIFFNSDLFKSAWN